MRRTIIIRPHNLVLLLAILLTICPLASAQQETGNDVLHACSILFDTDNETSMEKAFQGMNCAGYVAGLNDMAALMQGLTKTNFYCLPKKQGLETGQTIRVFLKWLQEHPETLHESARSLFISAMGEAFPCK